jgi:hypothetical protein
MARVSRNMLKSRPAKLRPHMMLPGRISVAKHGDTTSLYAYASEDKYAQVHLSPDDVADLMGKLFDVAADSARTALLARGLAAIPDAEVGGVLRAAMTSPKK